MVRKNLAIGLVLTLTMFSSFASSQSKPQLKTAVFPPVYQKWLSEDVVWIINMDERLAFAKLHTDAERDQFVRQFWERRDPMPGTPHNEFKEEHYRRIAYANEHFASTQAGWKTDRGKMYIAQGPPREISSLSIQGHPAQVWKYEGKPEMRFVDTCDCNGYELQK